LEESMCRSSRRAASGSSAARSERSSMPYTVSNMTNRCQKFAEFCADCGLTHVADPTALRT
jgi:membrane protease subunit (stomatin/prohibitin family)